MRMRIAGLILFVFAAAAGVGCGRHGNAAAPTAIQPATNAAVVQAVTITGGAISGPVPIGQSVQLKATAQMADGSVADVSALAAWTSDDPSVAAVNGSGLVTANRAGNATITARYQDATGRFPIVVHDSDNTPPAAGTPGAPPAPPGSGTTPGSGATPTPPSGGSSPNPPPSAPPTPPSQPCTSPLPVTLPNPLPPCPTLPPPVGSGS